MKKISLIYSFNTNNSKKIAEKIAAQFGEKDIEIFNAEALTKEQFLANENLILSVPTWFDGELPNYWDEFVPALEELELKGKKVAIFGMGDQEGYPENFLDAVGTMAALVEKQGAKVVGHTSNEGYKYEKSKAAVGDKFLGLGIDEENQSKLTEKRITDWVADLKKAFK